MWDFHGECRTTPLSHEGVFEGRCLSRPRILFIKCWHWVMGRQVGAELVLYQIWDGKRSVGGRLRYGIGFGVMEHRVCSMRSVV